MVGEMIGAIPNLWRLLRTGATWKGAKVGSLGDAAYYTFGLTKNMTTLKGAMVTTDDRLLVTLPPPLVTTT